MAKFLPEDKESGLTFIKQKEKAIHIYIYIFFSECALLFCIATFYIYLIYKYIVSPVRLFKPNQYLAD